MAARTRFYDDALTCHVAEAAGCQQLVFLAAGSWVVMSPSGLAVVVARPVL